MYQLKQSVGMKIVQQHRLKPAVWVGPPMENIRGASDVRALFLGDQLATTKGILTAIRIGDEKICASFGLKELARECPETDCTWLQTLQLAKSMECLQCGAATLLECPFYQCTICWSCHQDTCRNVRGHEVEQYGLVDERFQLLPYTRHYCRKQIAAFAAESYGVPEKDVIRVVAELRKKDRGEAQKQGLQKPGTMARKKRTLQQRN